MHIFIDESGNFTSAFGLSAVCALSIPSKNLRRIRRELIDLTVSWPHVDGELKSGSLTVNELAVLVGFLFKEYALLHCAAIDMSCEEDVLIEAHKSEQAERITKHLTPEHHPNVVNQLWHLRRLLEAMPNQLYVQSIIMRELVCAVVSDTTTYFAQRQPRELASFSWIIDAKDPARISAQEEWWRDTLGPLVETRSEREPFPIVDDRNFQYKHFNRSYRIVKDLWRPDRAPERKRIVGIDLSKLICRNIVFADSRSDILVQAVDVLTGFIRRALAGHIHDANVWAHLGRLQIRRNREGLIQPMQILSIGHHRPSLPHLMSVIGTMGSTARAMLIKRIGAHS